MTPFGCPMPLYYFDVADGQGLLADTDGLELTNSAAVRAEAVKAIAEIAKDQIQSSREAQQLTMTVRNEQGSTVLVLSIGFTVVEFDLLDQRAD